MQNDFEKEEEILRLENELDDFQRNVSSFLTWLSEYHVGKEKLEKIPAYIHVAHDVERIGDITVNFWHMAKNCAERDLLKYPETAGPIEEYFKTMDLYAEEILEVLKLPAPEAETAAAKLSVRHRILAQLEQESLFNQTSENKDIRAVKEAVLINDTITILARANRHLLNIAQRINYLTN